MKRSKYTRYATALALAMTLAFSPMANAKDIQFCGVHLSVSLFGAYACPTALGTAVAACGTTVACPGCTAGIAAATCTTAVGTAAFTCGLSIAGVWGVIKQCF
jgi:hypothetical protein